MKRRPEVAEVGTKRVDIAACLCSDFNWNFMQNYELHAFWGMVRALSQQNSLWFDYNLGRALSACAGREGETHQFGLMNKFFFLLANFSSSTLIESWHDPEKTSSCRLRGIRPRKAVPDMSLAFEIQKLLKVNVRWWIGRDSGWWQSPSIHPITFPKLLFVCLKEKQTFVMTAHEPQREWKRAEVDGIPTSSPLSFTIPAAFDKFFNARLLNAKTSFHVDNNQRGGEGGAEWNDVQQVMYK